MIEPILYYSLGFLTAALLALMVMPPFWRRAVRLTTKRIQATMPLTMGEIQAERDKVRAEAALATRRMEIALKSANEKVAAQLVEIERLREAKKDLTLARETREAAHASLEARLADAEATLAQREASLREVEAQLVATTRIADERSAELDRMGRLHEDATFDASSRQIELVARQSELDTLQEQIAALKSQRKEADRRLGDESAALKIERDALKAEKRRAADLERRSERTLAKLAEAEERLERRDKEIARLRDRLAERAAAGDRHATELAEARDERNRLKSEAEERARQLLAAVGGDPDGVVAALSAERDKLQQRLAKLTRENNRLRSAAAAGDGGGEALRDQLQDLAARVAVLTARLEGPGSPVLSAVAEADGVAGEEENGAPSLADRIRALLEDGPSTRQSGAHDRHGDHTPSDETLPSMGDAGARPVSPQAGTAIGPVDAGVERIEAAAGRQALLAQDGPAVPPENSFRSADLQTEGPGAATPSEPPRDGAALPDRRPAPQAEEPAAG